MKILSYVRQLCVVIALDEIAEVVQATEEIELSSVSSCNLSEVKIVSNLIPLYLFVNSLIRNFELFFYFFFLNS